MEAARRDLRRAQDNVRRTEATFNEELERAATFNEEGHNLSPIVIAKTSAKVSSGTSTRAPIH